MREHPPRKLTREEIKAETGNAALRKEQKQDFKPAEFRKFVNRRVDALKEEIYNRGLTPSEVSKTWVPIKLGLDAIERKLLTYRESTDVAERTRIENEVRAEFAQIEGEKFDDVYEATQEKMLARARPKGKLSGKDPVYRLAGRYEKLTAAEAEAFSAEQERKQRILEIRAQIKDLEARDKSGKNEHEPEILRLEEELRKEERVARGESSREEVTAASEKKNPEVVEHSQKVEPEQPPIGPDAESVDYGVLLDKEFPKVKLGEAALVPAVEAVATSTPETVRENKIALRRSVEGIQDLLAERAGVKGERDAMNAAGQKYFEAYKELHRSGFGKADSGPELENVKDLEREYAKTRTAYAAALEKSRADRIERKGIGYKAGKALEARYDRAVRAKAVLNEIIKPASELKTRARIEGLNEKGRGAAERAFGWFAAKNKELEQKYGKLGATAIRVIVSAGLITGISGLAGAFGTAGLMTIAGYGAVRTGRALASAFAGTGITETVSGAYEGLVGKKKRVRARGELDTLDRSSAKDGLAAMSEEQLLAMDEQRERLANAGDETNALKNKAIIKALVSMGLGGATYGFLELSSVHEAAGTIAHTPELRPSIPYEPGALRGPHISAVTPVESVSADHGDGGIRLLKHLHAKLEHDGVAADKPALARLFHTDPEKLAKQLGLYKPGAQGGLENIEVPKGSTLAYSSHGEVVLTLKGGESVTLIDSAGHIPQHEGGLGHFIGLHHAERAAPNHHVTDGIDHGSADTRILNQWELDNNGGTPPADLLHHAAEAAQVPGAPASAAGFKTLQDFASAPKPVAEAHAAAVASVPASSNEAIRTLGDFANAHESVLDPSAAHMYESAKGEYLWGGTGSLDDAAQRLAYENHASVFVNHSYNDPLRGRVVSVTEFRPFGEGGKALPPVVHTESAYDLDPAKDFTKRIN